MLRSGERDCQEKVHSQENWLDGHGEGNIAVLPPEGGINAYGRECKRVGKEPRGFREERDVP